MTQQEEQFLQVIRTNDTNQAKLLIEKGINVNLIDTTSNMSVLMLAAQKHNYKLCELLMAHGADLFWENDEGVSIFDKFKDDTKLIAWLDAQAKKLGNQKFKEEALKGNLSYITEYCSNVNQETLAWSFVHTPSVEIAKLLKDSGIDINVAEQGEKSFQVCHREWKYPALATACKENFIEKAQWLIKEGADINAYWYDKTFVAGMANVDDIYRLTPLMWAVKNRNIALIQLLIEAGASVNLKGHNGDVNLKDCTALEIAEEYSYSDYIEIANLLKSAGAKE